MNKKKAILITGNGFDLHHNLPTSYKDFISVLRWLFDNKTPLNQSLHKYDLNNIFSNYKNKISKNVWFNYFDFIFVEDKIKNWIDFEQEIFRALTLIDNFYIELNNNYKDLLTDGSIRNSRGDIVDKPIKSKLKSEFLNGSENELKHLNLLKKVELEDLYKLNEQYFKFSEEGILKKFNIEEYLDFISNELKNFEDFFRIYLRNIVPSYNIDTNCLKIINENIFHKFEIVKHYTFNYTLTAERYNKDKKFESHYLHGTIHNVVIFGIDNIENFKSIKSLCYKFTKFFKKITYVNKEYKTAISVPKFTNKYMDFENDGFEGDFIIFGHSLSKNDERYVKYIFDFVNKNKSSKIFIYSLNESSIANIVENLLNLLEPDIIDNLSMNGQLEFLQTKDLKTTK